MDEVNVWFVGGPRDGLVIELDPEKLVNRTPPALWKEPILEEPPSLKPKHWLYYYESDNKTYYLRKGVHDG